MAGASPDSEAQLLYDELNRRGVFKGDDEAQAIGHELRHRGVVADPTQGGLIAPKPVAPAAVAAPPIAAPNPAGVSTSPAAPPVLPPVAPTANVPPPVVAPAPPAVAPAPPAAPAAKPPRTVGGITRKDVALDLIELGKDFAPLSSLPPPDPQGVDRATAVAPSQMKDVRPGRVRRIKPLDFGKSPLEGTLTELDRKRGVEGKRTGGRVVEGGPQERLLQKGRNTLAQVNAAPLVDGWTAAARQHRQDEDELIKRVRQHEKGQLSPQESAQLARDLGDLETNRQALIQRRQQIGDYAQRLQVIEKRNVQRAPLDVQWGQQMAKLRRDEAKLKPLEAALKARKLTPERARRLHEQQAELIVRRRDLESQQRARETQKPIHHGRFYAEEMPTGGSSTAREFAGRVGQEIRRDPLVRGAQWLGEQVNPFGQSNDALTRGKERERAKLQLAGRYPMLPDLPAGLTPDQKQQHITEKNKLWSLLETWGHSFDDRGRWTGHKEAKNYSQPARVEAMQRVQALTPWQRQILPRLRKIQQAEHQVDRNAGVTGALAVDTALAGLDVFTGGQGGKGVRLLVSRFAKPLEERLLKSALPSGVKTAGRLGLRAAPSALGGALVAAPTGAAAAGAMAALQGGGPKDIFEAAQAAVGPGVLFGAAAGAGFGAGLTPKKILRPTTEQFYRTAPDVVTRPKGKGTPARPQPVTVSGEPLGPPVPEGMGQGAATGPKIRTPQAEFNLRQEAPEHIRTYRDAAAETGDQAGAARAQQWLDRHAEYDEQLGVAIPFDQVPDYLKAQNAPGNPAMAQVRALKSAAQQLAETEPELAEKLREAGTLTEQLWKYDWLTANGTTADVGINVPRPAIPAQASLWRRLSPEERQKLPAHVREALLVQDIHNSVQALDPTSTPIWRATQAPGRPRGLARLAETADTLFMDAETHLDALYPAQESAPAAGPEAAPVPQTSAEPLAPLPAEEPTLPQPAAVVPDASPEGAGARAAAGVAGVNSWLPDVLGDRFQQASDLGLVDEIRQRHANGERPNQITSAILQRIPEQIALAEPGAGLMNTLGGTPSVNEIRGAQHTLASEMVAAVIDRVPLVTAPEGAGAQVAAGVVPEATLAPEASDVPAGAVSEATAGAVARVSPEAAPARPIAERRTPEGIAQRKAIEEIADLEEARAEIARARAGEDTALAQATKERQIRMVDRKTGLQGAEAWAEKYGYEDEKGVFHKGEWFNLEKKDRPRLIAADADSLKWVNDRYGHAAGDALLRGIGDALRKVGLGDGFFHPTGDEYNGMTFDAEGAENQLAAADEWLNSHPITFTLRDGTEVTTKGFGLSYVIGEQGEHFQSVDERLARVKAEREAAGRRAARGEQPPGFVEVSRRGGKSPGEPTDQGRKATARDVGADQGKVRVEVKTGVVEAPQAPTRKPLWEMSSAELDTLYERTRESDREVEVRLLGEEGAKRYRALDRKMSNPMTSSAEMDAANQAQDQLIATLTPDEYNEFFGIGQEDAPGEETIGEFRRKLQALDIESPEALGESLKYAVTRIGDETDPAKMNLEQQMAYAQLREGFRIAQEEGFDTGKVTAAAVKGAAARFAGPGYGDRADAEFMLRRFIKDLPPEKPAQGAVAQAKPALEAPTAKPEAAKPVATGRKAVFKSGDQKVEAKWAVVEAGDLVTSNTDTLGVNPAYPKELQPRDRGRMASKEQLAELEGKLDPMLLGENPLAQHGAPITGPDLVVESGNGRTIALRRLYSRSDPKAAEYREWLAENADQFGLDPKAIAGAKQPVLVRVRSTEMTPPQRQEFTHSANARETAEMGAVEQATADAGRISDTMLAKFNPSLDGDVTAAQNKEFLQKFMGALPSTERAGLLDKNGQLSKAGVARVQQAVFAKVYGNPQALARLAEDPGDPAKNVTNALLGAAPDFAQLQAKIAAGTAHPVDLAPDVAAAAAKMGALKESGSSVGEFLGQSSMFADDLGEDLTPLQRDLLGFLDENKRSSKRIAAALGGYADAAERAGDPSIVSDLADSRPPNKEELWQAAKEATLEQKGLFTEETQRPSRGGGPAEEAAARPADEAGVGGTPKIKGRPGFFVPGLKRGIDPDRVLDLGDAANEYVKQNYKAPAKERAGVFTQSFELGRRAVRAATRQFENLPETGRFMGLKTLLTERDEKYQRAAQTAADTFERMFEGLDETDQYKVSQALTFKGLEEDLGLWKQAWEDAGLEASDFDAAQHLPEGLDEAAVLEAAKRVDQAFQDDPKLYGKIIKIRTIRQQITDPYLKRYRKVHGREPNLNRQWYMRRLIQELPEEYQNVLIGGKKAGQVGKTISPIQQREGSRLDFSTHFMETEADWIQRVLLHDYELRVVEHLQDTHDIMPAVRLGQAALNKKDLITGLQGVRTGTVSSALLEDLGDLAAKDMLPDRLDSHFAPLIAELHAAHASNSALSPESTGLLKEYAEWLLYQRLQHGRVTAGTPKGYSEWDLTNSPSYRQAFSIPQEMMENAIDAGLRELNVPIEVIQKAKVLSRKKKMLLPDEVVNTLKQLSVGQKDNVENAALSLLRGQHSAFKLWTLFNPTNYMGQFVKNGVGDHWRIIRGAPKVFGKLDEGKVRSDYLGSLGRVMSYEFRRIGADFAGSPMKLQPGDELYHRWLQDVGEIGLQFTQEGVQGTQIPPRLRRFAAGKSEESLNLPQRLGQALNESIPSGLMGAKDWAKRLYLLPHNTREKIARFAAFKYVYNHTLKHGSPPVAGASKVDQLLALKDPWAIARQVSEDLVGNYRQRSEMGRSLRRYVFPFYSFEEIRNSGEMRLLMNAVRSPEIAEALGKSLPLQDTRYAALGREGVRALAFTRYLAGTMGPFAMIYGWNRMMHPEEQRELERENPGKQVLILAGKDKAGQIPVYRGLDTTSDFLDDFLGVAKWNENAEDVRNGRMTPHEVFLEMSLKNWVNKGYQMLRPELKYKDLAGQKTFPDVFQARPARDREEHLFEVLSLGPGYRWIKSTAHKVSGGKIGEPVPQKRGTAFKMATGGGVIDVLETQYYNSQEDLRQYLKRQGKSMPSIGGVDNQKSHALYWAKQSVRLGDPDSALYFLWSAGKNKASTKSLVESMLMADPLSHLPRTQMKKDHTVIVPPELRNYLLQLKPPEALRLRRAYQFYQRLYTPQLNGISKDLEEMPIVAYVPLMQRLMKPMIEADPLVTGTDPKAPTRNDLMGLLKMNEALVKAGKQAPPETIEPAATMGENELLQEVGEPVTAP